MLCVIRIVVYNSGMPNPTPSESTGTSPDLESVNLVLREFLEKARGEEARVEARLEDLRFRIEMAELFLGGHQEFESSLNADSESSAERGRPTRGEILQRTNADGTISFTARWQHEGRRRHKVVAKVPADQKAKGLERAERALLLMRMAWGTATEEEKRKVGK